MEYQKFLVNDWRSCTLCRSGRQSVETLVRANERRIEYPSPKETFNPVDDPVIPTTIDEAFDSVMQFLSMTTRQCRRYYSSHKPADPDSTDAAFCRRYFQPEYTSLPKRNPLQRAEDVRVQMTPGTYSVTAGRWGEQKSTTHVVHLEKGQSVQLTFTDYSK
ncbi:A-kinase-interacting protein 1-like [Oscarella lobularis]|uniref:A-kinase-interacting protein 1-like n=1 Tax=Oscarella lobularis TaxID=121494 RepID=UPI0033143C76